MVKNQVPKLSGVLSWNWKGETPSQTHLDKKACRLW
jgi:hypothetical protein